MIRHTGGFALGATSTRSRSCSRAVCSACGSGFTPSRSPFSPTRNTSRARIRSLILASVTAAMSASPLSLGIRLPQRTGGGHGKRPPLERPVTPAGEQRTRHPVAPMPSRRAWCRWIAPRGGRVGKNRTETPACGAEGRVPPTSHVDCRIEDTSVSSLWTPYGEHQPEPGDEGAGGGRVPFDAPGATGPGRGEPGVASMDEAEADEAEVRAAMARLAATPVADIVANHAIGLWQLAVL